MSIDSVRESQSRRTQREAQEKRQREADQAQVMRWKQALHRQTVNAQVAARAQVVASNRHDLFAQASELLPRLAAAQHIGSVAPVHDVDALLADADGMEALRETSVPRHAAELLDQTGHSDRYTPYTTEDPRHSGRDTDLRRASLQSEYSASARLPGQASDAIDLDPLTMGQPDARPTSGITEPAVPAPIDRPSQDLADGPQGVHRQDIRSWLENQGKATDRLEMEASSVHPSPNPSQAPVLEAADSVRPQTPDQHQQADLLASTNSSATGSWPEAKWQAQAQEMARRLREALYSAEPSVMAERVQWLVQQLETGCVPRALHEALLEARSAQRNPLAASEDESIPQEVMDATAAFPPGTLPPQVQQLVQQAQALLVQQFQQIRAGNSPESLPLLTLRAI